MHDIVLLSTADWDNPFWTNKQHVALELAGSGYRVLYIDSLGLRRPGANLRDLKRIAKRLFKALLPPRKVHDNLWVWSPIMFPWQGISFVRRINRSVLSAGLLICLRQLGLKREYLWTYNPLTVEFLDLSRFSCLVYHCVDEIKAQPGMPVDVLDAAEKKLAMQADIIFTTSPQLTETRQVWNEQTYYLPNVADFNHFSSALKNSTRVPSDLKSIPCPRLGFIGAISAYKVDFRLIRQIALAHPEWSIVLIGSIGEGEPWTDTSILEGLKNLYLPGPRNYQVLPAYLKGFDVALLPNCINEYTDSMFPMKFFEYLSAGLPVVSVNLKALGDFADVVTLADSAEHFISSIEKVLAGDAPPLDRRLEVAAQNTYEKRTKKMLTLVEEVCRR